MGSQLHSPLWYRVAELCPALRQHLRVHRHVYRQRVWYVLHDPASGRSHRFPASAQRLIALMDGQRTVQQIWDAAGETLGDQVPTQGEMIRLLSQLHAADLLRVEVAPDTRELFARYERRERGRRMQRFANPMALRFPIWDPDRFLGRTAHLVRPLFSRPAMFVWLAVVAAGALLASMHWREFMGNLSDQMFAPLNLLAISLAYPVIKGLHELGHGYATRIRGGEVHEMGIMLLVFMPVPYVDASGASAFPDKRHRMLVGAAGIAVEMFIAAVAMIVWVTVEPGGLRALAYNVALIGGVSTVLFNGNPLLKFDGYYVLADLVEIPNLSRRANQYVAHVARRYLLGVTDAPDPAGDPGERAWLSGYACISFCYRVLITVAIVLFVAEKVPFVGMPLALYVAATRFVLPFYRAMRALGQDPEVGMRRHRLLVAGAASALALALILFVVPMPLRTQTEGVTWLPPQAEVRAGADATVVRLLAAPGSRVAAGDPLIETSDPEFPVRVAVLSARQREIAARHQAALALDPSAAISVATELESAAADLELARQREAGLVIRSPAAGIFIVPEPEDLPGRYVRQGDRVAYIAGTAGGTIISVVNQADIGLVRARTERVTVRLADAPRTTLPAVIRREIPGGTSRLPSAALGAGAGGSFAVDPADPDGTRAMDRVFQIELGLSEHTERLGGRAYVRFDHGTEPLAAQWYRQLRQLFLSRFDA